MSIQSLCLSEKGRLFLYPIRQALQLGVETGYLPISVFQKLLFVSQLSFQVLDFFRKVLQGPVFAANGLLCLPQSGFQRSDLSLETLGEILGTLSLTSHLLLCLRDRQLQVA